MTSPSEEDRAYAGRLVGSLLDRGSDDFRPEGTLVASDVEADAAEFADELEIFRRVGSGVPAMVIAEGERVPVSLGLYLGQQWPARLTSTDFLFSRAIYPFDEYLYRALRGVRQNGNYELMDPDEARSTYLRRATDFLATRIAAVRDFGRDASRWPSISMLNLRQRIGGAPITTPGCTFVVTTNSTGLRVFWSGAYRITSNYFSHPTTPAASVLQAGTYVFGVDGGAYGNDIRWDSNAVVTLPGNPHVHLNY